MANNEFGDFQTNAKLAATVVGLLGRLADAPATVIEPTCGRGSLVQAAINAFPLATVHGLEINSSHVADLEKTFQFYPKFILHRADYFQFDWNGILPRMAKPVWVVGNPPWVTNSHLMKIDSTNLPKKSPQAHLKGFDAQTGKSNFDISESMIRDWFNWCAACSGSLAVICKTSVARKLMQWWWKGDQPAPDARIYLIDAKAEFDVSVSACILVCSFSAPLHSRVCAVFDTPNATQPSTEFGLIDGHLVSNARGYLGGRAIMGKATPQWRSGLKHDAGSVLELRRSGDALRNKAGLAVSIEEEFVYPLVKGSDLVRQNPTASERFVIVPQRFVGDDVERIRSVAPRTWSYLMAHRSSFVARKSVIYKKGGDFGIFGIGEYSFSPWKIAIGALYKQLNFRLIGPLNGRPVMFDDTVYFVGFDNEQAARGMLEKLESKSVRSFLESMIFWDDMRPIKTEILNRLNLTGAYIREAA